MHDSFFVRCLDRFRNLLRGRQGFIHRHRSGTKAVRQCRTINKLQDQPTRTSQVLQTINSRYSDDSTWPAGALLDQSGEAAPRRRRRTEGEFLSRLEHGTICTLPNVCMSRTKWVQMGLLAPMCPAGDRCRVVSRAGATGSAPPPVSPAARLPAIQPPP